MNMVADAVHGIGGRPAARHQPCGEAVHRRDRQSSSLSQAHITSTASQTPVRPFTLVSQLTQRDPRDALHRVHRAVH